MEVYKEFLREKESKGARKKHVKEMETEKEVIGRKLTALLDSPRFKPEFLKTQTFREKMGVMRDGRKDREDLKATLVDLKSKIKEKAGSNLNFFRAMEGESSE